MSPSFIITELHLETLATNRQGPRRSRHIVHFTLRQRLTKVSHVPRATAAYKSICCTNGPYVSRAKSRSRRPVSVGRVHPTSKLVPGICCIAPRRRVLEGPSLELSLYKSRSSDRDDESSHDRIHVLGGYACSLASSRS